MHILGKLKKTNRQQLIVLTSVLLIIVGLSIWLYATSVIQEHEQLLNTSSLTQEEIWTYEGALQWWKTTSATTVTPVVVIMTTAGFVGLLGPTVWGRIHQKQAFKAFTEKLELASADDFEIE
jgi:hypothetical protein